MITLALRDALAERMTALASLALLVLFLGLPLARGASMGASERAAVDLALWVAWMFGSATAMWLGTRCIAKPLADRSALWILTGPTSPGIWGLGRIGGALGVALAFHGLVACVALLAVGWPSGSLAFLFATSAEVVVLVSLAALLGTVFPPLPSLAAISALWTIGHLAGLWQQVVSGRNLDGPAALLLALLPDLDLLDVHGSVVSGVPIPGMRLLLAGLWASAWTAAALAGTVAVLNRRDFQ